MIWALPEGQLRLEALRENVPAVEPALLCPAHDEMWTVYTMGQYEMKS